MSSRSHHGCTRCKTRRQKCDEARPNCGRCVQAGEKCEYTLILKWNGRTPRLPQRTRKRRSIEIDTDNLTPTSSPCEEVILNLQLAQQNELAAQNLGRSIDPWSGLSDTCKHLLTHFVNKASLNAPHSKIRDHVCRNVVPMIFNIPSLFHATMALAGLHHATLLRGVPAGFVVEEEVANHLSKSIRLLRHDLQEQRDVVFLRVVLYTIRTLCVCEIYSGKADTSWRIHVNGARAIFESALSRAPVNGTQELIDWLTFRWYSSIEALTALTDRGLRDEKAETNGGILGSFVDSILQQQTSHADDYYFNIYTGYSSDLDQVFKEIGSMIRRYQRGHGQKAGTVDAFADSESELRQQASLLEQRVLVMMSRDDEHGLKLPLDIELTAKELGHFRACNKAYQYSALIHIHRKAQTLDSATIEVQACVQEVLSAALSMQPVIELSPWVLMTTPLYTAGCEAFGGDRDMIRHLLQQLYETLRIRNTLRAISILEAHWSASELSASCDGAHERDTLDFIPY